ncbi:MAG: cobalamin biosynthesis protein CobD [Chitinivibrionales bacterium]|nr:cobalamin biosynthesis protein CobD [Chitinivibrionales bacterium]
MMRLEYQIVCALLLDLLIGDPQWLPHPVRVIGWCAESLEKPMRRLIPWQRLAGIATAALVIAIPAAAVMLALYLGRKIHPIVADCIAIYCIYASIAARDLADHCMRVLRALQAGDISAARTAVSMVVGRDTRNLSEKEIVRAGVETVAESLVDGVTAPLFFAFIGGPVGAAVYKSISTLDSTFGYRSPRYLYFGWASARLDDLANFLPARLTAPVIVIAAFLLGLNPVAALKTVLRDGRKHDSPNAGIPEAAFAGALGVQLGGLNYYGGDPHEKPLLGELRNSLEADHIRKAIYLMYVSTFLFVGVFIAVRFLGTW